MKVTLIGTAILVFMGVLAVGSRTAVAATTLNVNVGGGENSIAAIGFFPNSITVLQGDTIHFTNSYAEPHTTTFLPSGTKFPPLFVPGPSGSPQFTYSSEAANPTFTGTSAVAFDATKYFNSGIMLKDAAVSVSFPQTGSFQFICLFHSEPDASGVSHDMTLDVKVVSSGTSADTQTALDARAQSQLSSTLAAGEAASSAAAPAPTEKLSDGSTRVHVLAGTLTPPRADGVDAEVMRFISPNVSIKVGDTVEWSNNLFGFLHTITFGTGATLPDLTVPLPQSSGPPLLELNPAAFAPAGGTTYDGTGVVNTGALGPFIYGKSASVKFTKAGAYTYVCLIHADQGMKGTITVAAATTPSPIVAPNTGSGPPDRSKGGVWIGASALMIAGVALALAGARRRLRSERLAPAGHGEEGGQAELVPVSSPSRAEFSSDTCVRQAAAYRCRVAASCRTTMFTSRPHSV